MGGCKLVSSKRVGVQESQLIIRHLAKAVPHSSIKIIVVPAPPRLECRPQGHQGSDCRVIGLVNMAECLLQQRWPEPRGKAKWQMGWQTLLHQQRLGTSQDAQHQLPQGWALDTAVRQAQNWCRPLDLWGWNTCGPHLLSAGVLTLSNVTSRAIWKGVARIPGRIMARRIQGQDCNRLKVNIRQSICGSIRKCKAVNLLAESITWIIGQFEGEWPGFPTTITPGRRPRFEHRLSCKPKYVTGIHNWRQQLTATLGVWPWWSHRVQAKRHGLHWYSQCPDSRVTGQLGPGHMNMVMIPLTLHAVGFVLGSFEQWARLLMLIASSTKMRELSPASQRAFVVEVARIPNQWGL